jgi:hypothetical protein
MDAAVPQCAGVFAIAGSLEPEAGSREPEAGSREAMDTRNGGRRAYMPRSSWKAVGPERR